MIDIPSLVRMVNEAREAFEKRWQIASVRKVDVELYERFSEQHRLYRKAIVTGDDDEAQDQAEAMVRAYQAITQRMTGHVQDAYLKGYDPESGTSIVISEYRQEMEGCIWVTPNALARLVASHRDLAAMFQYQEGEIEIP